MDSVTRQDTADQLLERLLGVIGTRRRVLTAFSGGVDSTLVAAAARRALGRENAPVVIGDSSSLPRHELDAARAIAAELDVQLFVVRPGEQDDPDYRRNDGDRCYFCKRHLYTALRKLAADLDAQYVANGTNLDDFSDHRPGLRAAREAQVISPLVEASLGKEQVRIVARRLGLPNWEKPAAACLASRVPYGLSVTPQRLAQIEKAEDVLRQFGFTGFRVRHHGELARIELPWDQAKQLLHGSARTAIIEALKDVGYRFVTLDLEGFRSGSSNVLLTSRSKGR